MTEVKVGQLAPDFAARELSGREVRLSSLIGNRKALLLFYRGGWCPFCNEQLAAISRDYQRFQELKTAIVAVSGEEVEKGRDLLRKLNLPFVLLSDTSLVSVDRYGVRDENLSERTKARGIIQLPKPSAFVIDEAGIVRYKYVGKNAPDRPKNEDLLGALKEADKPGVTGSMTKEQNAPEGFQSPATAAI